MTRPDDDEVLPQQTRDDTPSGWGDDEPTDDEDVRRLLAEKPPHYE
jgi:hypothetical protein